MTFPLGPLGNKLLAAAASGVAASAVYVTAKVTFSFCAWTFYAGCALVSAKLLFGKYYRSLEDSTSHFTGFGTEIGMTDLDPALFHNQHQHQDRIDLNLHLAPPPMESTYGFLPLGSGFGVDMLNPSPAAGIPNHSTMWPRLTTSSSSVASTTTTGGMFSSVFFDNISSGPPSPGEIDFTAFQQQPPFWGFDFPEADPGHHEHLDLDLSPLHFLQEQEVQIGSSRENHQTRNAAIQPPASSRRTPSAAATDALPKNYTTGAGSCFTKKNSGSASASADASSPQQQPNNNSKEEEDPKSSSNWKDFFFDCNVCLDVASEPVVTSCGHLFCWPCLYQWLHVHSHNAECPVCKGAVSDSDIVPIYGRGGSPSAAENIPSTDVPGNVPPRPRARRSDSVRQRQAARWRGGGDHMLHEMLRWRRAVQFMQENVDRIFNHGGGHHHHHRRPRRRMPERREQQHFARSAAEDALLAAMHERMGMPSMEMEHTAASIQARIASVEGMIDQLHHPWQTPPPPFIDLTTPDTPLFTPMLPRDPAAAYPILHGLRRMPV